MEQKFEEFQKVENPEEKEDIFVHQVYNEIASHFSQTRYKPWPIVDKFLKNREPGSIGLDVGCGNGKYMNINKDIYIVGSDFSQNLVSLAFSNQSSKSKNCDSIVADGIHLPHADNKFEFAISIAVIHHFSSKERRVEAVKHILQKLSAAGEALIYVWALEQKNSRRGWNEGMPQDVLVPWVTQKKDQEPETKYRYYHLYKKGELEDDVAAAGGSIVESGYEKDNWWAIIKK